MTAQGEDILAWTLAAIARREETARAATEGPWEESGIGDYGWTVSAPSGAIVETDDSDQGLADAQHIALNEPESVLRRCAADRKLLELHGGRGHSCPTWDEDGDWDETRHYNHEVCPVILAIAEGYGWTETEGEQPDCGDAKPHAPHTFLRMEVLSQCPGEHGTEAER